MEDIGLRHVSAQDLAIPESQISRMYASFVDVNSVMLHVQTLMDKEVTSSSIIAFRETLRSLSRPLTIENQ